MKITDSIPGNQISYEKKDEIVKKIFSLLNPNELQPLDLWKELTVINKADTIKLIENNLSNDFYLLYTYYQKKVFHGVFQAGKETVTKFIDEKFNEEWDEGIDIIIADVKYNMVIMGNHDGVLVRR